MAVLTSTVGQAPVFSYRYDLPTPEGSQSGVSIEHAAGGFAVFFSQSTPDWDLPGPGVMMLDEEGNVQVVQAWPDTAFNELISARGGVATVSTGGYLVPCTRFHHAISPEAYNMTLRRLDEAGNTLWVREYGDSLSYFFGHYAIETADGGFLISGARSGSDVENIMLWKVNALGDPQWTHSYGGEYIEQGGNVIPDGAGGYYLCGSMGVALCDRQLWLTHLDSLGNPQWTWMNGGPFNDDLKSVTRLPDGDLIVFGNIQHDGCNSLTGRPYIARISATGDLVWERYVGAVGFNTFLYGGILADANSLLGVGSWFDTDYRGWSYQISFDGDSICSLAFSFVSDSIPNGRGVFYDAIVAENGDLVAVGSALGEITDGGTYYSQDTWCLRAEKCGTAIALGLLGPPTTNRSGSLCWPNPTTGTVSCTVQEPGLRMVVRDFLGRVLTSSPAPVGSSMSCDLSTLSSGIYLVQFVADGRVHTSQRIEVTH